MKNNLSQAHVQQPPDPRAFPMPIGGGGGGANTFAVAWATAAAPCAPASWMGTLLSPNARLRTLGSPFDGTSVTIVIPDGGGSSERAGVIGYRYSSIRACDRGACGNRFRIDGMKYCDVRDLDVV